MKRVRSDYDCRLRRQHDSWCRTNCHRLDSGMENDVDAAPTAAERALDVALQDFALRFIRAAVDVTLAARATGRRDVADFDGRRMLDAATEAYCALSVADLGPPAQSQNVRTCERLRNLKLLRTAIAVLEQPAANVAAAYCYELNALVSPEPELPEEDVARIAAEAVAARRTT